MECSGCKKPMFRAKGNCGEVHYICIPCDIEFCTLYGEEEHLSDDPEGRRLHWQDEDREKSEKPSRLAVKKERKKKAKKEETEKLYEKIIFEADGFLGDIMGELAESQYDDQGGSIGMVEGRFELSDDEIKDCMFEALSLVDNHGVDRKEPWGKGFDLEGLRIDRQKLVDHWFKKDYK